MFDIVLGLIMGAIGAAMCLRGYLRMTHTFPLWTALTGLFLGAGIAQCFGQARLLCGALGMCLAFGFAAAIGVASARFYEVSALLVPTSMGVVAATIVMVLAHLEWSWIIAGSGALVGLLFGSFAIISSLHRVVLTVMTALCGAAVCVAGLMLAVNTIDRTDLGVDHTTVRVAHTPWWWIAGLALALVGGVVQTIKGERHRVTMRDRWVDAGGGQMRAT